MFVDTHCHIHEPSYPLPAKEVIERARGAGVEFMICVGTSQQSSREAVQFVADKDGLFAAIGVHPHDTKDGWDNIHALLQESREVPLHSREYLQRQQAPKERPRSHSRSEGELPSDQSSRQQKLVAIGEIGLDYYYNHSPKETQIKAFEAQLDLALRYDLPVIFHVREAFDDFWPIFDNFHGVKGVLHSFTDSEKNLEEGLKRGLYVGVNGISTFTKDALQKKVFMAIPLDRMLLETDAPFLTPAPFRGTINESAFVRNIAEFHAIERGCSLEEIAVRTTTNARTLFAI